MLTIRPALPSKHPLPENFLYEAIFLPEGVEPSPREITSHPDLQVYTADFGTQKADFAVVADMNAEDYAMVCAIEDKYNFAVEQKTT